MNLHFLRNLYLGSELTEDQLQDIPYPRAELHYHVMYKNLQVNQSKLTLANLNFIDSAGRLHIRRIHWRYQRIQKTQIVGWSYQGRGEGKPVQMLANFCTNCIL